MNCRSFVSPKVKTALAAALALLAVGCATVPGTGRKQLNLIPSSEMSALSAQSYQDFLTENPPVKGTKEAALVKKVGAKVQAAVEAYMKSQGRASELDGYAWSFEVVQSDDVNAWCMPGGRVVFYTGILPIAENETGVAVVMGHEVAHAIAEHGNERMSQQMVAQFGGMALSQLLREKPQATQQLWMTAYGVGAEVGALLPFSRLQESEADELGLTFMAMAGYDPRQAVDFWQRMSKSKGGGAPPEFLSTHPSDSTRIADIKKHLPAALEHYHPKSDQPQPDHPQSDRPKRNPRRR